MNKVGKISTLLRLAVLLGAAFLLFSCNDDDEFGIKDDEGSRHVYPGEREEYVETRRVLLLYECGFNSLYGYIAANVEEDIAKGNLPGGSRKDDVLLVFSKIAQNAAYKDVPSYLRRIYKDSEGKFVSDTIKTYPTGTVASSPSTMSDVLRFVKSTYPAKGYGMIFSSHGSGWLPQGYYNNPSAFERNYSAPSDRKLSMGFPYPDIPEGNMATDDPYAGMVRSLGQDMMSYGQIEMSVSEFVEGIPFHLDYLLFDMCFSGGMEVVYALKDKADYLGVSPAEVLAMGMFDYTTLTDYLLKGSGPDLRGLFEASFKRYDSMSGSYRSSTVNLVRTSGLEDLAAVCKDLVSTYSVALSRAPVNEIQGYFRANRHYFYDLEDTFVKCGASQEDLTRLRNAIDECVVYKNATPAFLDDFPIKSYSGFSIYLPCNGSNLLNTYFKKEEWNEAVEFVK